MRKRTVTLHGDEVSFWETGPEGAERPDGGLHDGRDEVVVLIHGIAGSARTWAPFLEELARRGERRRVIAPDLLGHGASAKPKGDYSLGGYATAIRDLLAALGHHHATIVGHSLGGGVALQFVYQFPQSSDRLVLIDSGGLGQEVNPALRAVALPGAEWVLPLLTHRQLLAVGMSLHRFSQWLLLPEPTPSQEEAARSFASLSEGAGRRAFIHTVRSVIDLAGQRVSGTEKLYLAEGMPTLIVWGTRDSMIPVAHGRRAHEMMPGSRLELFEGAGHFPHGDQPQRFTDVFTDFLGSTTPSDLDAEDIAARLAAHAQLRTPGSDSSRAPNDSDGPGPLGN